MLIKRIIDIIFAFVAILVITPLYTLVAVMTIIVDGVPVFFLQDRIGQHRKPFVIYKLRTMKEGKVTALGRLWRKTGVDELPQLINVLKGDMSFVGPRPLTKADVDRLGWDTSFHDVRWSVLPGIVGLAQLAPVCHKKMSWFYDRLYLKSWSLWLDIRILSAAVFIPFVGKEVMKKRIHGKR